MASTSKTPYLGLCKWSETDRPKRSDFVSDNDIIDTELGGHIADTDVHVTLQEKELYKNPYSVITYAGDGVKTKTISIDFEPSFVIVYQMYYPSVSIDSDSNVVNHFAIVGRSFGTSDAIQIHSNSITVSQDTTAIDGVKNNFNEQYGQYVILLFR